MLISEVATYLAAQGLGTAGTNIFYSHLPDNVDECLAVIDTGGTKPDIDIPTKRPTFQVYIRAATYTLGKTKLDAVRTALHNKYNLELVAGQTYFYSINALAEGGHVGRNERGLDEFSINFVCYTR
jgi:hypothetical protein